MNAHKPLSEQTKRTLFLQSQLHDHMQAGTATEVISFCLAGGAFLCLMALATWLIN